MSTVTVGGYQNMGPVVPPLLDANNNLTFLDSKISFHPSAFAGENISPASLTAASPVSAWITNPTDCVSNQPDCIQKSFVDLSLAPFYNVASGASSVLAQQLQNQGSARAIYDGAIVAMGALNTASRPVFWRPTGRRGSGLSSLMEETLRTESNGSHLTLCVSST